MKADVTYCVHKKYGNIMRLIYEDKSKVYLSKKGLTITLLKSKFRKGWNKKRKYFGFTFNNAELDLLMKALNQCESQWKKLKRRKRK